jgi:hypothetical protein
LIVSFYKNYFIYIFYSLDIKGKVDPIFLLPSMVCDDNHYLYCYIDNSNIAVVIPTRTVTNKIPEQLYDMVGPTAPPGIASVDSTVGDRVRNGIDGGIFLEELGAVVGSFVVGSIGLVVGLGDIVGLGGRLGVVGGCGSRGIVGTLGSVGMLIPSI